MECFRAKRNCKTQKFILKVLSSSYARFLALFILAQKLKPSLKMYKSSKNGIYSLYTEKHAQFGSNILFLAVQWSKKTDKCGATFSKLFFAFILSSGKVIDNFRLLKQNWGGHASLEANF